MDLKALKIAYHEIKEDEKAGWSYLGNYICHYWDVVLYSKGTDFYFTRRNYNGELYNKIGHLAPPTKCEDNLEFLKHYKCIGKYRLRYWEKQKNI